MRIVLLCQRPTIIHWNRLALSLVQRINELSPRILWSNNLVSRWELGHERVRELEIVSTESVTLFPSKVQCFAFSCKMILFWIESSNKRKWEGAKEKKEIQHTIVKQNKLWTYKRDTQKEWEKDTKRQSKREKITKTYCSSHLPVAQPPPPPQTTPQPALLCSKVTNNLGFSTLLFSLLYFHCIGYHFSRPMGQIW